MSVGLSSSPKIFKNSSWLPLGVDRKVLPTSGSPWEMLSSTLESTTPGLTETRYTWCISRRQVAVPGRWLIPLISSSVGGGLLAGSALWASDAASASNVPTSWPAALM